MRIKSFFLFGLICLVTVLFIFHSSIHTFFITSAVKYYFHAELGRSLHYENVRIDGHKVVFIHPSLLFEEGSIEAEHMTLTYAFDLPKRMVDVKVELEKPLLQLEKSKIAAFNAPRDGLISSGRRWIHVRPHILARNGSWILSSDHLLPLNFNFDIDNDWKGYLTAYYGDQNTKDDHIFLEVVGNETGLNVGMRSVNLSHSSLMLLKNAFFPSLGSLTIPSGRINGSIKASFPEMQNADPDGKAFFDIAFEAPAADAFKLNDTVDIHWMKEQGLVTLKWEEQFERILELLPLRLERESLVSFANDRIEVLAELNLPKASLEGTIHLRNPISGDVNVIQFGGSIEQDTPRGRFYANEVPLEKFLSPFLFRRDVLDLSGTGEFKGVFDGRKLLVKYNVENIELENDHLRIEAKHLHSAIPGDFIAFHEFDLGTAPFSHRGELPLINVSYLDKNYGLLFEDVYGTVHFHNQNLSIQPLETYCRAIYFAGSIQLDYSDPSPGVFNLDIQSPVVTGKVSQIQALLAHVNPSASLNLEKAFEGDFLGRNHGLELAFTFLPHDYHLDAHIQGAVNNGALPFEDDHISLKGLSMDVDYHHDDQCLELSDIQGTVLVGKPRCVEEYVLVGDHLRVTDLKKQDIDLDLSVKDQEAELVRIVASTELHASGLRDVHLNRSLTHISRLYPQTFVCRLKGTDFEAFQLQSQFELQPLINDLSRFRKTGLSFLSHEMIEKIISLKPVREKISLSIVYQPTDASLVYSLEGNEGHHFSLQGRKTDKKWIVDQLQWDKLNLFADLQQMDDRWKIHSLGFNDGECLLIGLQGEYFPEGSRLKAKINFCEVNLKGLSKFGLYADLLKSEGTLKAQGEMEAVFLPQMPWVTVQADLKAIASDWNDIQIKITNDHFQMSASAQYQQLPFQWIVNSYWPAFDHGNVIFTDPLFKTSGASFQPLQISWKRNKNGPLDLQSIQGQFSGLWCDLSATYSLAQKPGYSTLQGKVDIDFNSLSPLLDPSTAEKIGRLDLGGFYTLDGTYWIDPVSGKNMMETLFFLGNVTSVDILFKGYQLSNVEGALNYTPESLEIDQLVVEDPSGSLLCPHLKAVYDRKSEDWFLDIPEITVKKFKPALLRKPRERHAKTSRFKNLVIKKMELREFSGTLFGPHTWLATGGLHFHNTASKDLTEPLFAIPKEIIQHLELDPALLNPVTGSIYYELRDGKFVFTKMKDVFSEGRGSKFYLADPPGSSWMDMEGNLSAHIRMKQHNLIFKMVEQFTLSIEGNIKKPLFSLQKQGKGK